MDKRTEVQTLGTGYIVKNKFKGILQVAPRVGKCKIVIDALNTVKKTELKVLVIAPKVPIFIDWKKDIIKWNLRSNIHIDYLWSNSLKKITKQYDLIVADEIHAYNLKVLYQLAALKKQGIRILGLTGTLDANSEFNINQILNIEPIYTYNIEEAIKDKIIADYQIYCIGVNLDNVNKNMHISEDKPALTEKVVYEYWDARFKYYKARQQYKKMNYPMLRRKEIIYNSQVKLKATKKLIKKINRCIIFTARQAIADQVGQVSFHSNSKKDVLEQFKNGKVDQLAVISMVSMGVTIHDLKNGIFNQIQSGENDAIQKAMRCFNIEGDKIAKVYIIYLKQTQDEVWLKSALRGFNENKIKYCKIKDL